MKLLFQEKRGSIFFLLRPFCILILGKLAKFIFENDRGNCCDLMRVNLHQVESTPWGIGSSRAGIRYILNSNPKCQILNPKQIPSSNIQMTKILTLCALRYALCFLSADLFRSTDQNLPTFTSASIDGDAFASLLIGQ
jgi:hypothetical protein